MRIVDQKNLRLIAASLFAAAGCSAGEAAIVAGALVEANLKGHDSHGVVNLPTYVGWLRTGGLEANQQPTVLRDDGPFLVIDGNRGLGPAVARRSVTLGIAKARETGAAILAIRRSGHMGRIGAYGEQCAEAGLVSLHFVNVAADAPVVAPFAGREARFSTNPFCFAMPASAQNAGVILDCATSKVAWGKLKIALNKGQQAPEGAIIDSEGRPTRDPAVVVPDPNGALVVFGEHKGSGIALFCELLAGALTGGDTVHPGHKRDGVTINNMLSILIDPARTTAPDRFAREYDAVLDYVRDALPLDPNMPVQVPGEPEQRRMEARLKDGIPLDDQTWSALQSLARDLKVDIAV